MKRYGSPTLALVLMLAAVPLQALEADRPKEGAREDTRTPAPPAEQSNDRSRQKSTAPAATFTPSERIEADSAVSFPVDI